MTKTQAGQATTSGSSGGGSVVALVAHAARIGPAEVATVLQQYPAQRDEMVAWLHANRGSSFVRAVIAQPARGGLVAWDVVATPHTLQFPETEVGAVSPPCTVVLVNRGQQPIDIASLEIVPHGGTGEPSIPGELELIEGQASHLRPFETMAVQVVFRPTRVVPHITAHLRAHGPGDHQHLDVLLKATPAPPRPEHADQRELSVAQHTARQLEVSGEPSVERYGDMLTAVLAARALTDRALHDDAAARARVTKLLEPVAKRLNQLNDHQGHFAQFGAGNIAGQAALDMAESAVRSWLQLLALGAWIGPDELVLRFRAGAEPIRFLTGEHADAPTLREFDHVSRVVGIGAAAPVMAPALIALAAEEAPLLAFASRLATRRITLWALAHPAAALAASEALLGFGVQIGEGGWDVFWDQLGDPQGRWFILMQVFMDYMNVKGGMSGHGEAPSGRRSSPGPDPAHALDVDGARQRLTKLRAEVRQVHDAAEAGPEVAPQADDAQAPPPKTQATTPQEPPTPADGDRSAAAPGVTIGAGLQVGKADAAKMLLEEIGRNAGGLRRPALDTIEPAEIARLKQEFADLGGDPAMLRFNQGTQTGFLDRGDIILVRGDVNPVDGSLHPRSAMSSKAALGHELGHAAHRGTRLPVGAWNDEFRASYWAAKNLANLAEQDRVHLILDAMERAKEAGVPITPNALMRKILYGY